MPEFLQSDDDMEDDGLDGGLLSGMKRRTRRQYDERKDIDDLQGIDDVSNVIVYFLWKPLTAFSLAGATIGTAQ